MAPARSIITTTRQIEDRSSPPPCETCGGSGVPPGTKPETCKRCKGAGISQNGPFRIQVICPQCRGTGKYVKIDSPFPPSDKIGIKSVQREVEEILDMKQLKMDWFPYIPLGKRTSAVERLESKIYILNCVQRRYSS